MQSISSDARFLGVDLKALWQEIRQSWQRSHQWPLFSWLTPAAPVLLLQADAGQSLWLGDKRQLSEPNTAKFDFVAVELPEELILRRSFSMPLMGEADIAHAVSLEVRTNSPFVAPDLVWEYRAHSVQQGGCTIDLVIASRKQIAAYLASQAGRWEGAASPEVWVCSGKLPPIVLAGYGEGSRNAYAIRRRRAGYALLTLALVLLGCIAVTPTAQLRLRAIEAVQLYEGAIQRTAPLARQREALMQSVEKLGVLSQVLAGRIEPLRVLDQLTQVLPDDTALQSFKLQGTKVVIVGDTVNASALLQLLGEQPGLHEVRAPAAATRMPGAAKESFVIEFTLDPQQFGVVGVPAAALPVSAPEGPVAAVIAPAPVPVPVQAEGSRASAAPANPPAATGGGRAVFGGSMPTLPAAPASGAATKSNP